MAPAGTASEGELPPGQRRVAEAPVVHVGEIPSFDAATWHLRVEGAVQSELRLAWRDVLALPQVEVSADMHAGTGWSAIGLRWEGVPVRALAAACEPRPSARFVLARDADGYGACVPLDAALATETLLALRLHGDPLQPARGGPLRLVVPSRYAWKSVKWVRSLVFLEQDEPGFWESRGAHANGDPWRGQRMS